MGSPLLMVDVEGLEERLGFLTLIWDISEGPGQCQGSQCDQLETLCHAWLLLCSIVPSCMLSPRTLSGALKFSSVHSKEPLPIDL
jgi:hypothetical protein